MMIDKMIYIQIDANKSFCARKKHQYGLWDSQVKPNILCHIGYWCFSIKKYLNGLELRS